MGVWVKCPTCGNHYTVSRKKRKEAKTDLIECYGCKRDKATKTGVMVQ